MYVLHSYKQMSVYQAFSHEVMPKITKSSLPDSASQKLFIP